MMEFILYIAGCLCLAVSAFLYGVHVRHEEYYWVFNLIELIEGEESVRRKT